ncbi:hypothetical protein CEUSTIGMA_g757.t1 [Chlamydomonas eustigma]|uniref:EGF-like domain-containing protein n=1 Tax=Chlamydomonas eustigma TaxID=1157962 RepID=A0A250WR59_9CHLO|nr:hypothetical protein CEUSTIGMA_g757.t1 [Chlamydomonas eustigma]|eukprot:GAX73303.1 hypothetical protein CEUSTIGMA_g757.t1 [Chlamydomonas eustigma]
MLVILLTVYLHSVRAWIQVQHSCQPGCEVNGNCNLELGVCECNFGWTGKICEVPTFGACRSSNSSTALVMYGTTWPKSCECWRQITKFFWDVPNELSPFPIPMPVFFWKDVGPCFERIGVLKEHQFSDIPMSNETNVKWFTASRNSTKLKDPLPELEFVEISAPAKVAPHNAPNNADAQLVSVRFCPQRCHDRGSCFAPGHCVCRKGFKGDACEEESRGLIESTNDRGYKSCLNNCSNVGSCLAGYCHCPVGLWGSDCSRSKAFAPDPGNETEVNNTAFFRSKLKIYRYELPWQIAFPLELSDGRATYDKLYSAFEVFHEKFFSDWVTRTENPYEANLFYIPLLANYYMDPKTHIIKVLRHIQTQYPRHISRYEGRDHFIWLPLDMGACPVPHTSSVIKNLIKVTHFGLQISKNQATGIFEGKDTCFKHERDVVAPAADVMPQSKEYMNAYQMWKEALDPTSSPRKHLLYFGGSFRLDAPEYSGGARQAYHEHVVKKNDPRVKTGGTSEDYRSSNFCFCPYGQGFGNRIQHIVLAGCVPVTVQEHVHQPLDDVVLYQEFSIILTIQDMPQLLDILSSISRQDIWQMRMNMFKVRKALYWHDDGLAYNYTLKSLHRKLHNIWGYHY